MTKTFRGITPAQMNGSWFELWDEPRNKSAFACYDRERGGWMLGYYTVDTGMRSISLTDFQPVWWTDQATGDQIEKQRLVLTESRT